MRPNEPTSARDTAFNQWMAGLLAQFADEAVGMWQIVPGLRHELGLDETDLAEFTAQAIRILVDHGARPVKRKIDGLHYWEAQHQLGKSAEEIARNAVTDWRRSGEDPTHADIWFATPAECEQRNVPVDKWLADLPLELGNGVVPTVDIVLTGRGSYGLDGERLATFIGQAVRRLLENGARAVQYMPQGPHEYTVATQYGESIDEVVAAVTAAWLSSGDPYLSGLHFATREIYEARRD